MQRRTREVWSNLVRQYEQSGATQEEFAAHRGIPVGTLRSWIYRLKRERAEEAAILPVRVVASTAPLAWRLDVDAAPIEVLLPDGVRVRFVDGATIETVAALVGRLRGC